MTKEQRLVYEDVMTCELLCANGDELATLQGMLSHFEELLRAANSMCFALAYVPSQPKGLLEDAINTAYEGLKKAIAKAEGGKNV